MPAKMKHFFLLITITSCVAQVQVGKNTATFVSPDRSFEFKYPRSFVFCQRGPEESQPWIDEACNAYAPICSDYTATSTHTIACIGYPHDKKLEGTTFQGAAFSVNVDPDASTQRQCWHEPEPATGSHVNFLNINGSRFRRVGTDGVEAGNYMDGDSYRTFHNNKCYELDIRIGSSNAANYDPGTIREFDSDEVRARLETVMKSFTFLK